MLRNSRRKSGMICCRGVTEGGGHGRFVTEIILRGAESPKMSGLPDGSIGATCVECPRGEKQFLKWLQSGGGF